jgi:hypothetical protein
MPAQLAVATASTLLFVQSVSGWALAESATSTALALPCPPVAPPEVRPELLFLKAEVGPVYVDTVALKDQELLDAERDATSGFGVMHGVAVGLRAREFWAAARYRRGNFSDWDLWTVGGEAGATLSFGRLAPHVSLGAGYASLDGLFTDVSRTAPFIKPPAIAIHGVNVRVELGLEYYFSRWFSLGASVSGDAFFLHRKGDNLPRLSSTDPNDRPTVSQAFDGSGTGLGAALSFMFGLHY